MKKIHHTNPKLLNFLRGPLRILCGPLRHSLFLIVFLLALAVILPLGCATHPWTGFSTRIDPGLVWPPPPEPARVAWVTQIRGQEDLFQTAGFWRNVGEMIGGKPETGMERPYAVALHPAGGLLVADPGRQRVHFYDWGRRRYVEIGSARKGGLPSPVGVAALADGRILVSDSRLGTIESFNADGKWLGPFCAAGVLGRPAGLAASAARGEVCAVDVARHEVRVFDLGGRPLRTLGSHGAGPGQFNYPTHIALDGQGRLVVTDSLNFRVQILNPDGSFVSSFGELGDAPGKFSKPKGVAVDGAGHIIVIEGLFDAMQFFDGQGRLLMSVGASGHGPGEFWLPGGICYDAKERLLFVADSSNKRVQVFRLLDAAGK